MNRHGVIPRTLVVAVVMLGAAVASPLVFSLLSPSQSAQGGEPQVLLLASDDLGAYSQLKAIQSASRMTSLDQVHAVVQVAPAVVIVDSAYVGKLKSGDLRSLVDSGSAVIGLGIPISELNDLTNFELELGELNTKFTGQLPEQQEPDLPFYSLVWRTPEGANPARFSRLQQFVSDGFFERIVRDFKLKVQGLIRDGDRVVPLEEYGQ